MTSTATSPAPARETTAWDPDNCERCGGDLDGSHISFCDACLDET